ncbi:MAG: hypothetical protein WCP91_01950 [Candidatus Berkelbacteria bacterium]
MQHFTANSRNNNLAKRVISRVVRLAEADNKSSLLIGIANVSLTTSVITTLLMIASSLFSHDSTKLIWLVATLLIAIISVFLRTESIQAKARYRQAATKFFCRFWPLTDLKLASVIRHMGKTVTVLRQSNGCEAVFDLNPRQSQIECFLRAWRLAGREPITMGYESYYDSIAVPFCDDARPADGTKEIVLRMTAAIGSATPAPFELHSLYGSPNQMYESVTTFAQNHIKAVMAEMATEGGAHDKCSLVSGRHILSRLRPELMVEQNSPLRLRRIDTFEQVWVKYPA